MTFELDIPTIRRGNIGYEKYEARASLRFNPNWVSSVVVNRIELQLRSSVKFDLYGFQGHRLR